MLDFLMVASRSTKKGVVEIYPKFILGKSNDLMIRGQDFYAIWNDETKLWSTDEDEARRLIDKELDNYAEKYKKESEDIVKVLHMWDAETGMIDRWHKYCQKQMRDSYHPLDEKLIFANTKTTKRDYSSKVLPYALEPSETPAYDELISTLYSPEERKKLEWAIGSVVSGDSKKIQKFVVLYGSAGTGKSTVLNIIQKLFEGYYAAFDAKALGSLNNVFALEAFKTNPLVAIDHDSDLSRIEDNTRINSIVSHELMTVNEKFKSAYASRFNCFLFIGTNRPVRITDAKSGIIRRLIDISPSGNKIQAAHYHDLVSQIDFELGGIATHCLGVYKSDPRAYDDYIPANMLGATNDFYNYILDAYDVFKAQNGTTLKAAWEMYKTYCEEAKVAYPYPLRIFKEELKNYFKTFEERTTIDEDTRVRNYYSGFLSKKFEKDSGIKVYSQVKPVENSSWLFFSEQPSVFDEYCKDCAAQYATDAGTPSRRWANVTTTVKDLDTHKLHYVKVPVNHIVIDFDIHDEEGNKSFDLNYQAASKWPQTYAELSKSGAGIHLHYIYEGDPDKLSRIYDENIEVKVFKGDSSLRRLLTKCNDIPINAINSGLPLKGDDKKMVTGTTIKSEQGLRRFIARNLAKDIHPGTKPSVEFIKTTLDRVYAEGLKYDVSDMRQDIYLFARNSTHHAKECTDMVDQMKLKSDEPSANVEDYEDDTLVFFDVEVFDNLFVVVWKPMDGMPVRMINPTPPEIEELLKYKLIGFNNRRYDNHILYGKLMGYSNHQLFLLSQRIINSQTGFFGEAYNLSYADIYDFSSKKQSLKKFEIELGIHHQELGLKWDEPVPEELWNVVADYCVNDVIATEATFKARAADFDARKILASISGLTVNDTTRMHTTKIIFGDEKHPDLVYTDLSEMFPGYTYENGHSSYRGEDPGEGGYVYAEPGMYTNVALLDIASMHPSSIRALNLFGSYTSKFTDILDARLAIKHHDYETAGRLLNGAFKPYLTSDEQADRLAAALKIVINSVYGYTTASFDNPFKDIRNKDNIVAKRGALFMINLKHEVQDRGFTVAHIKTDSIKIPNATPEIIQFVMDYGKQYGYSFEHEATYDRICLVNDAVYIAKYADGPHEFKLSTGEKLMTPWTATGTQFQVPYVFKTLFAKAPLKFEDLCETKTVTSYLYLDMNEEESGTNPDYHDYVFVGKAGQFCPIIEGAGGGLLMREKDGKYYAATGTKGFRWLESETVKTLGKENDIDHSYYESLVNDAVDTISQYGDFEWFVSNDIQEGDIDDTPPFDL